MSLLHQETTRTFSELIHAGVVGVVHEVADRINARVFWATVPIGLATERRAGFFRCVQDVITWFRAATLESMI
jgi:hypothetical protein